MNAIVRDVMSDRVVAVRRGATFKEMAAKLHQFRISAFPVIDDDGTVVGVVSEADLLAKEALAEGPAGLQGVITGMLHRKAHAKADGLTAGDLMTHPAVTVGPEDSVKHAARMMYSLRVKRLPVADSGGHLVGIVSRADVLTVFDRPDSDILAEITGGIILRELLIDPAQFTVMVADGVVTLRGNPETAALGRDLVVRIRRVEGVVAVRDELAYPPAEREITPGVFI